MQASQLILMYKSYKDAYYFIKLQIQNYQYIMTIFNLSLNMIIFEYMHGHASKSNMFSFKNVHIKLCSRK